MSNWPLTEDQGQHYKFYLADTSTTVGTTITNGTWVEVTPAAEFDVTEVYVSARVTANGISKSLSIGVGAAGTETSIFDALLITGNDSYPQSATIPISIPKGTRVALYGTGAGVQSVVAVAGLGASGFLSSAPTQYIKTYGLHVAATGRGVTLTMSNTAHVKSAWTEIAASTDYDTSWIALGIGGANNSTMLDALYLIDVAAAPAGSESSNIILENIVTRSDGSDDIITDRFLGPFPMHIPKGTRLAARMQRANTLHTSIDLVIHGGH